jgi:holo-[acyl-carrier protein] synthase
MMGIGVDIVRPERFPRLIDRIDDDPFLQGNFTCAEKADARTQLDPGAFLAARFAAKEACLKALNVGLEGGIRLIDLEKGSDATGRPVIRLLGKATAIVNQLGGGAFHIALSTAGQHVVATVLWERTTGSSE